MRRKVKKGYKCRCVSSSGGFRKWWGKEGDEGKGLLRRLSSLHLPPPPGGLFRRFASVFVRRE